MDLFHREREPENRELIWVKPFDSIIVISLASFLKMGQETGLEPATHRITIC